MPSKSVFAARWLAALRTDGGDDGLLGVETLYTDYLKYADLQPTFGDFNPQTAGDFVFASKKACTTPAPTPPPAPRDADGTAWNYAQTQKTEESYQFYLDTWKAGRYRREAQQALDGFQEEQVWTAARQKGTAAAYANYTAIYCPGGRHCGEVPAKAKIPEMPDDGLVFVPGGTFKMGCTDEQKRCQDDEKPAHNVTLNDFYIGKYEVTQKLWREVMGNNPSDFIDCDDCPVEQVSWDDVQIFLQKLSQQTGRQYRLPTEAEWEYAARGGGKAVLFGNGQNTADPAQINFDANATYKKTYSIAGTYRKNTVPVGSLNSANALGLYDMSGNVWEWCSDWYNPIYYENSPASNPTGPTTGTHRVFRGGSWDYGLRECRVAYRSHLTPNYHWVNVGFRLARTK